MKSESPFDREQAAIRWNTAIHTSDQQRAEARDRAVNFQIDEVLFESWWSFVQAGKAYRLSKGEVEAEGYPEKVKPAFEKWKQQMQEYRELEPRDFLEKCAIWNMGHAQYLRMMDEIIEQVSGDIFERLGPDFLNDAIDENE